MSVAFASVQRGRRALPQRDEVGGRSLALPVVVPVNDAPSADHGLRHGAVIADRAYEERPCRLGIALDEYCYRLNRRDKREDIFRRLLNRCLLYTDPTPYSLLTGT